MGRDCGDVVQAWKAWKPALRRATAALPATRPRDGNLLAGSSRAPPHQNTGTSSPPNRISPLGDGDSPPEHGETELARVAWRPFSLAVLVILLDHVCSTMQWQGSGL
jgi:hypothetical protein